MALLMSAADLFSVLGKRANRPEERQQTNHAISPGTTMAPHFFVSSDPPPVLPPPSTMASRRHSNNTNNRKLSSYFAPLRPPPVSAPQQPPSLPPPPRPSAAPKPAASPSNPALDLTPYSDSPRSYPTPHPQITIDPVKTAHIPSLMRITGLLLPIRYPTSFYSSTITDPLVASVSKVAVYHDHPVSGVNLPEKILAGAPLAVGNTEKVIGGIRCRLEPLPAAQSVGGRAAMNLYIQTLHLLSPYRGNGVAASLLYYLIYDGTFHKSQASSRAVSTLVKHYNIRTVTAHVHETNEDALQWYIARGFKVEGGTVEGYYRKLNPGGAKIVKLELNWVDNENVAPDTSPCSVQDTTVANDDDEEWEKVDAAEYPATERLEDYQQINRDGDLEESANKRVKNS
ncbi:conserved hypothetical protein [Uncinocarpus reesii 1704]|uniref:N-acetyltransferase domain-containing protein n=1 Tax=Uncinocarpus reesii (strain UAMH 1704) TaxID=336963 RepID=C4JPC5_UNCRE|nr:uncharacterized protein UREG_04507 [Uncinocarpus reesii 1704]EEP79661.1 conserved hypothetical protein [Uncinocarpus reesii 1704]